MNHTDHPDFILGISAFERPAADLVIAVARAGATGVLDLGREPEAAAQALARVAARCRGNFAVRVPAASACASIELPDAVDTVVVADLADTGRFGSRRVLVEVTSVAEAEAAVAAGAGGLVAKGHESGGRIGNETTFVLLGRVLDAVDVPVWAAGGIGVHSAAACALAGARGVVLDAQLALVRESTTEPRLRAAIAAMDGSETRVISGLRVYTRPDLDVAKLAADTPAAEVRARFGADLLGDIVPAGQDAALAKGLAERFVTAGRAVTAVRSAVVEHLAEARRLEPLAPGAPLAESHGIEYPIAQGPMTRVSDTAAFACAVAEGGALPFLALALMGADDVRKLLEETVATIGEKPWGVGILGFVPAEIREAQLAVVSEFKPPVALIAGGRPSQAKRLEDEGTTSYLHVPSPGLLARFLKDGARNFVFEGRECGGHVGPRTSFVLWEQQIDVLLASDQVSDTRVLFAGGIHDARSAAMVAAMAAPLAARGAKIGVLMGTAYLFTEEAVAAGAIQPAFQRIARECSLTALLETSPGHATRAADTEFVRAFEARKKELEAAGAEPEVIWADLEQFNLGRLRIATKGIVREGDRLESVGEDKQLSDGLYMIGQVAGASEHASTVAALHSEVTSGSTALLGEGDERVQVADGTPIDIAIVGMACVLPGAGDTDEYWSNILAGNDAVTEVPPSRWDAERYYDPEAVGGAGGRFTPSKWGGFIPDVPFDPLDYGIPPRSLANIDPVQLLALEVAQRALVDAGYGGGDFNREHTSVIFGAGASADLAYAYGFRALLPHFLGEIPEELEATLPHMTEDSFAGILTNVIAGRIANRLDLGGVNYTVDAACAASLAALDLGCKELANGNSDMVIAGGADLHNGIHDFLFFASVHALSPKGRCKTFDAEADGIALGEGVACVVIKRLADAERDGDRVYAVLKGVAGSSDGRSLGLTAPRPEGQMRALVRAYGQAGISPAAVGLVEAHGTGTVAGDRAELDTLTTVFAREGSQPGSCALGSVKSQIGHTKCAAGMAGLIKTTLAVYHGVLPPTLQVEEPNPYYDAAKSPFTLSLAARPWTADYRLAGVSAFGFGGSNFHAILEAYDEAEPPPVAVAAWPTELFLFRGETDDDARAVAAEFAAAIANRGNARGKWRLRDLARTAAAAGQGPVRISIVASSVDDLATKLASLDADEDAQPTRGVFKAGGESGEVAFLFPGQGSQRPGMLGDVFVAFPFLRRHLDVVSRSGQGGWRELMLPNSVFTEAERQAQRDRLTDTRVAQPTLGIAGLAMLELLERFGVTASMAGGHSYGEMVALAAAGSIEEEDLLDLSVARATAVADAAGEDAGTMAAVRASAEEVKTILAGIDGVVVANDNSPKQTVISGPKHAIGQAIDELQKHSIAARRVAVSCAFHSPEVAGATEALAAALAEVDIVSPSFPVYANSTAARYDSEPDAIRRRLAAQVAEPVRFREQIEAMYEAGARTFVEVGPGRVLTGLVNEILKHQPHTAVSTDVSGKHGLESLVAALAELAVAGVEIDAEFLFAGRDARVVDLAEPEPKRPAYLLNGHMVRYADGRPIEGGLLPADEQPVVSVGSFAGLAGAGGDREATVREYLAGVREVVAAQRDVMLGYLGETVEPRAARPMASDAAIDVESLPAAVAVEAPAATGTRERVSGKALMDALVAIVGERTGYTADMLEPDLDLEADLSIDSIKRIEILSELAEQIGMPGMDEDGVDEETIEELVRLKTLSAIVAWIDAHADEEEAAAGPAADDAKGSAAGDASADVPAHSVRFVPALDELEVPTVSAAALEGRRIVYAGDGGGVAAALRTQLEAAGATVTATDGNGAMAEADAFVDLSALDGAGVEQTVACFARVQSAAESGARTVLVVTAEGGDFGYEAARDGDEAPASVASGLRGMMRTVAVEYGDARCRSLDVDPAAAADLVASQILCELTADDAQVCVARKGEQRRAIVAVPQTLSSRDAATSLSADSVVLVVGGARGIAARAAIALADRYGCAIELIGRSAPPQAEEGAATVGADDEVAVRKALIAEGRLSEPQAIEAECRRILAEREMRRTLASLADAGARPVYTPADARDDDAFSAAIDDIYERHGRLDGVLYAAGILEDKFVRDKTEDSFRRVFETKVAGARTLARKLRTDTSFVAFFGSIAGFFGNRGQVDYAAGNDALGGIARWLDRRIDGRAVTVHWGPWAGTGMVTPGLERAYHRRGIGLIDADEGVRMLLDEIVAAADAPEVVVMRASAAALGADPGTASVAIRGGTAESNTAESNAAESNGTGAAVAAGGSSLSNGAGPHPASTAASSDKQASGSEG